MPYCEECGNRVDELAKFCSECGTQLSVHAGPEGLSAVDHGQHGLGVLGTETLQLSLAALEWLRESNCVSIAPSSPFGFLLKCSPQTTIQERVAASREFSAKGLSFEAQSSFKHSINILARPEYRLRISQVTPPERPALITLFTAGDFAALGYFDTRSFYVGAPLKLTELVQGIIHKLESASPLGISRQVPIWLSQIRLGTVLWHTLEKHVDERISIEQAISVLTRLGFNTEVAQSLVAGLIRTEFIEELDGSLVLRLPYRHCMELIRSRHMFEIEHTPLLGTPIEDQGTVRQRSKQMLYVGPPGRRMLCRSLSAQARKEESGFARADKIPAPREERLLILEYLDREALEKSIPEFLGLLSVARAAQRNTGLYWEK